MATAAGAARDVPLIRPENEARHRRAVLLLSFSFCGVFGGFQAAQGLQTSLNATLGGINLACLYGTFTLLCLVAPPLLAGLERFVGLRLVMSLSALAYVAMVLANVIDTSGGPSAIWAVPIVMNVLVGAAAPLLWTCQNDYLSRCAWAAAHDATVSGDGARAAETTTRFNQLFFSIYQTSGMFGTFLSSMIMEVGHAGDATKRVLFCTLGAISAVGAALFLSLPVVPASGRGDGERLPSLLDTGRLALSDPKTSLLIPLMLTNGMTMASFFGDFQTDLTCPVAGDAVTGFVLSTFYGVNALATACWGRLLARGMLSRRAVYVCATLLISSYLVVKLIWQAPQNYERDEGVWRRRRDPSSIDMITVFVLAALFACGDAFFESGPPATLQTFYAGSEKLVPAMANAKLWQSLGFAVQFPIGVALADYPGARSMILLALLAVSVACLLVLDRRVERLDPPAVAS
jgi:hypothetical protein